MFVFSSVERALLDSGYEGTSYFVEPYYTKAVVGVSHDGRLIYDYELMVQSACEEQGWTEEEAVDWIDYNAIRAIPYMGDQPPIVMYRLEVDDNGQPSEEQVIPEEPDDPRA